METNQRNVNLCNCTKLTLTNRNT